MMKDPVYKNLIALYIIYGNYNYLNFHQRIYLIEIIYKINCSNSSNSFSLIFSKLCFSKLSFKFPSYKSKGISIFL